MVILQLFERMLRMQRFFGGSPEQLTNYLIQLHLLQKKKTFTMKAMVIYKGL